ncbi:MAG TPA: 3-hydroxyanthranilate 3,4-dioxygenase [Gammaproteobacteria bacterium]|nr:3-hydroxyanthranilate 3,4-dioxygenase [Gammaproteobacteria bacterium]
MALMPPFNLKQWIDEHRSLLKPPVANREIYAGSEFIVMIVGGPNSRTDYHVDAGPELFYQLEGDMLLKTVQDDEFVDVPIAAGEMFLLPPLVPHSPRRFADTVGLVVERQRRADERDGFQWFCSECGAKLHERFLHVADIVADLPPVLREYADSEQLRTCSNCGHLNAPA